MTPMERAVIVDALRTPIGRYAGALKEVRPDDLAALVVRQAVQRNQLDPATIEDVYFGDANQAGEDNRNVARMAVLRAGLPVENPAATMNPPCGSGMQAAGGGPPREPPPAKGRLSRRGWGGVAPAPLSPRGAP